jgi:hypothetical protein
MKIAIFFSGRLESKNNKDQENILSNLLNLYKKGFDFYFSISESGIIDKSFLEKCIKELNVIDYNIEEVYPPAELFNRYKRPETNIKNMWSMYYHNKKCYEMIEKSQKKYDYIIKFRGDISYENFNIPTGIDSIYIPKSNDFGGINDQIAIGNNENMKWYCSLIDYIDFYSQKELILHPETLLNCHLRDLSIKRFDFDYKLI